MNELTTARVGGYRFDLEDKNQLAFRGEDIQRLSKVYRDAFPEFNTTADPLGVADILNQASQGACVGHAGVLILQICYFLATGRKLSFSRAAGYYLAQRASGIKGDNGATVDGFGRVATGVAPFKGLCLASDWPYPQSYDPREPAGVKYDYKIRTTKPFTKLQPCLDWLDLGLPLHTGMPWGSASDRDVVANWAPGKGGHSTVFWQRKPNGNVIMLNSWSHDWMQDGCNEWTPDAVAKMLAHSHSAVIGYAPDGMSFPVPDPI